MCAELLEAAHLFQSGLEGEERGRGPSMAEQQHELYRALGKVEAIATSLERAVTLLVANQNEVKLAMERTEGHMSAMAKDIASVQEEAVIARQAASRANERLDRIKWTAGGAGLVGGGAIGAAINQLIKWF